jgi:hypothetical protein
MTGAVSASMPIEGACSVFSQVMYSSYVSKTRGATGCQMPLSGMTSGAMTSTAERRPASAMGLT